MEAFLEFMYDSTKSGLVLLTYDNLCTKLSLSMFPVCWQVDWLIGIVFAVAGSQSRLLFTFYLEIIRCGILCLCLFGIHEITLQFRQFIAHLTARYRATEFIAISDNACDALVLWQFYFLIH